MQRSKKRQSAAQDGFAYDDSYDEYDDEYDEYDDEYDEYDVDAPADGIEPNDAPGAIMRAGSSAREAAGGAGRSLSVGFSAMRQVRQASKMRADAEADVRDIERGLEEDRDELAHREDVERNYHEIVAAEEAEIEDAQQSIAKAKARIAKEEAEVRRLNEELRSMRERHEQKLRPYRNLMDSSRGRSDDSAKSLANVRRSVRGAERALNEATKNRDVRISNAHRAVDNAQERVGAVEAELEVMRNSVDSEAATPAAIAKMERELSSNQLALEAARRDVAQVTQEAQDAVDQAQRRLLSLQREQTQAEQVAETNKSDATARKDEYDGLYRDAQAKERAQEEEIKSHETRIRNLEQVRDDAQDRLEEAQDILEEAHQIHAHPETTEGLRERIADEEADLEDAQADLEDLLQTERELRQATRGSRMILFAVVAGVLILVALIVWFLFLRG